MKKRLLTIFLALVLCVTLIAPATAAESFTINGHTVSQNDGTHPNNCSYFANDILDKIWPELKDRHRELSAFKNDYNILRNLENGEDRKLTEDHVRDYIQQAPLGSRIRVTRGSSSSGDEYDAHTGHTMVLVEKDNAAGKFTVLEGNPVRTSEYTYQGFVDIKTTPAKGYRDYGYNYFYYITDYSAAAAGVPPTTSAEFEIKDGVLVKYKGNGGDVTIPDGVTSIRAEAFYGCTGLTSVTIPNSVTNIFSAAFEGCTSLTSVTIPDSVTEIYSNAFEGCTGLSSVTIGNGVTKIGQRAFYGCTGLTSVTIGKRVTEIQSDAFYGCTGLTNIAIPNSVTSIHDSAFGSCTSLTSVTIPNSVTSIDLWAFNYCISLKDVYYSGTQAQWNAIKSDVGDFRSDFASATIHYNSTGSADQPTTPTTSDDFEIKDGVLVKYKGNGGNVVIPDNVTDIGIMAFDGCTDLTSVTIPNSVTGIWGGAFYGCIGLTNVTIPNSVTDIGQNAFYGCTGLTSITIPDSVTSITYAAFTDCTGMTAIQVSARNQKYASVDGVLFSKDLKTLEAYPGGKKGAYTIPSGTASIGICAFTDTGITSVSIPSSVTSIEWGVFRGCSYLTDIYYGGSEAQWKAIKSFEVDDFRDDLLSATIHYNSTMPGQPSTPAQPDSSTAYASTQNVLVDGKPVEFQAYALKDANGNDTNYVKLRDVAYALNGTAAQFSVGWDAANKSIAVTKGTAYAPDGTEMKTPFSGNRSYKVSASPVFLDGKQVELEAILLTDDAGNGYTYFRLGSLGEALGFAVNWSADKGIYIETK